LSFGACGVASVKRSNPGAIRLVVADDHPLVREGLVRVLAGTGLVVEGQAATGSQAVELVRKLDPDVVLLDIRMPDMDGLAALREIKREKPHTPIIMLTAYDEPAWLVQAIAYGAAGYLLKTMARDDLVASIKAVLGGDGLMDPARLSSVVQQLGSETVEPTNPLLGDVNELTGREKEVLALVTEGLTNQQIAEVLGVAASTIKSHVQNVILKLGASDRTQAAVMAVKAKIVPD
jgi:DNA-binding NarL/FixJ family response regulator